jgi:transcriptional regulator with XRE-family HTH domain
VENVKSPLNLALAAELRAERVAINMTIEELRERAGITKPTMLRILSGSRDINVTQLAKLAQAMNITAEDLFRRAVDRMGGMGALMSEAPTNNVHVLKSVDTLDTGELDAAVAQAALRDDEMNQSEHYQ